MNLILRDDLWNQLFIKEKEIANGENRMPTTEDFQNELNRIFQEKQRKGERYAVIKAGDLHRRVGGYPSRNHRMPICCNVMKRNMREGDEIMEEPPSGYGANLTIRYRLPRH